MSRARQRAVRDDARTAANGRMDNEKAKAGWSADACRRRGRRGADERRCDRRRKDRRMRARLRPRVELRPGFCESGRERMHRVEMRLNANERQRYRKAAIQRNCLRKDSVACGNVMSAAGVVPSDAVTRDITTAEAKARRYVHRAIRARIGCPARFGGQSHSTGYDGGIRPCKRTRDAVVDWRHSTNSRHFARFFFFSRFDKP